jgi:hypothetical protein
MSLIRQWFFHINRQQSNVFLFTMCCIIHDIFVKKWIIVSNNCMYLYTYILFFRVHGCTQWYNHKLQGHKGSLSKCNIVIN